MPSRTEKYQPISTLEIRGRRGIQAEAQPPLTIENRERANGVKALGVIISNQRYCQ